MARQSQEVAEASKRLVAADAEARREIVGVHRDIQQERAGLDEQQNLLEADRKALAVQKQREPLIANMLLTVGLILAALLAVIGGVLAAGPHAGDVCRRRRTGQCADRRTDGRDSLAAGTAAVSSGPVSPADNR